MDIKTRKEIISSALVNSFVDDYKAYKKTIDFINNDFISSNIDFQYSYDQFCIDFLDQTMKNIKNIDISESNDKFEIFYTNFRDFNLYNLQGMLTKKLKDLGYNYEDFFNNSKTIQQISDK